MWLSSPEPKAGPPSPFLTPSAQCSASRKTTVLVLSCLSLDSSPSFFLCLSSSPLLDSNVVP